MNEYMEYMVIVAISWFILGAITAGVCSVLLFTKVDASYDE
jgi:hypothetical protein